MASRKVGGAVQRNRAKRLLRETARFLAPRWPDESLWIVFVARESINGRTVYEVQEDIERAIAAANTDHLELK